MHHLPNAYTQFVDYQPICTVHRIYYIKANGMKVNSRNGKITWLRVMRHSQITSDCCTSSPSISTFVLFLLTIQTLYIIRHSSSVMALSLPKCTEGYCGVTRKFSFGTIQSHCLEFFVLHLSKYCQVAFRLASVTALSLNSRERNLENLFAVLVAPDLTNVLFFSSVDDGVLVMNL